MNSVVVAFIGKEQLSVLLQTSVVKYFPVFGIVDLPVKSFEIIRFMKILLFKNSPNLNTSI